MHEYGHVGDFDVFYRGHWLTTFYHITLGEVLDLVSDYPVNSDDIDVCLKV